MTSWTTFDCSTSTKRWRDTPGGGIEIKGEGSPTRTWPTDVNQWSPIIEEKAKKYNIPAHWIAALMSIESGGKTDVCYKIGGVCSTADGAGLMAVLASTAEMLIGRKVYPQEMMANPDLAVELGTMLMARLRDKYGDDFVKIAIGYNAGSIRCAYGSSGSTVPDDHGERESCPQTAWGVRMGCVRTKRAINQYCAPSALVPGYYVCPVDYPGNAIKAVNSAVEAGWTPAGFGVAAAAKTGLAALLPFAIGAAIGFVVTHKLLPSPAKSYQR